MASSPTRALPLTRARSSHGCQYWLRPGTTCAGPSAPKARRGQGSESAKVDLEARFGPEVEAQRALVGGEGVPAAQRQAARRRPRVVQRGRAHRAAGMRRQRGHRPRTPLRVAADGDDDDHHGAGTRLREAPEVALHADAVIATGVAEGRVGAGGAVGGQHRRHAATGPVAFSAMSRPPLVVRRASPRAAAWALRVLWRFGRPHTLIGTSLSIVGLYVIAASAGPRVERRRPAVDPPRRPVRERLHHRDQPDRGRRDRPPQQAVAARSRRATSRSRRPGGSWRSPPSPRC